MKVKSVKQLPMMESIPEETKGIPFWDIYKNGLTQSMISTFQDCPRKVHYKMREGLKLGAFNHALDFGTLFHAVLDAVYSRKIGASKRFIFSQWEVVVASELHKLYAAAMQELDPSEYSKFELMHGLCATLLPHYIKKYYEEDNKAQIIDVEKEFCFPYKMRNSETIMIRGKIDRVDKIGDEIWLFETKTKTSIDKMGDWSVNAVVETMSYQTQACIYALACEYLYGKVASGIKYNLVKRPGQEFKGTYYNKPETMLQFFERVDKDITAKPEYFNRYNISLHKNELKTWRDTDLDYWIENLFEWSQGNRGIGARNQQSCSKYRKPCEFLNICANNDRSRYTKRDKVFSELEEDE